jgi:hypothetical protein
MRLTARRLNLATLARQLLLGREPLEVAEAVRRVVALQAQEAASPYLALWNRLAPFDPADLDAAFAGHAVIKATLMRITLHAVTAADYPPFRGAMVESLRAARLHDRRYTQTGPSAADADALIPHLLEFTAERRTNPECEALLSARLGAVQPRAWWALRTFAPVVHAVTGGPWSFGPRPSALAAPAPAQQPDGRDACVQRLAWRYLEGFGPASAADLAQFTLLTLLVDGQVAGVWRPAGDGIEATSFHPLSERAWQGLADETRALVSFLAARDPAVYRRYAHWWKELPGAEVRVLPG